MQDTSIKQNRSTKQGSSTSSARGASPIISKISEGKRNRILPSKPAGRINMRVEYADPENTNSSDAIISEAKERAEQEKRESYKAIVTIDLFAQERLWKK